MKVALVVAASLPLLFGVSEAGAKECQTLTEVLSAVAKKGAMVNPIAASQKEAADTMMKWFNQNIAKDGPAKIGPRPLPYDERVKGTVLAPGDRTWITPLQASGPVNITLTKKGGKARGVVTVCMKAADGETTRVKSVLVDDDGRYKIEVPNAKDHYLSVIIDGQGGALTKLKYTLVAKTNGAEPSDNGVEMSDHEPESSQNEVEPSDKG